jgi:hypothetical protein
MGNTRNKRPEGWLRKRTHGLAAVSEKERQTFCISISENILREENIEEKDN